MGLHIGGDASRMVAILPPTPPAMNYKQFLIEVSVAQYSHSYYPLRVDNKVDYNIIVNVDRLWKTIGATAQMQSNTLFRVQFEFPLKFL